MLQSLDQIALALGVVTAGGGITGYARTGSIPSVAAGVSVGGLVSIFLSGNRAYLTHISLQYILSSYRLKNNLSYAIEAGLLASVVLAGSSIPRAIKSGKPLPIGLSVLALIGLYSFGLAFQRKSAA
jgi:uncharacterized membrane protein (UPF0136 family)